MLAGMPSVDVVDETFVVVPPDVLAAEFATPARWRALWPDLDLEVVTDRGAAGSAGRSRARSWAAWRCGWSRCSTAPCCTTSCAPTRPARRRARPAPCGGGGGGAAAAAGGQGDRVRLQGPAGGGPGGGGAARAGSVRRSCVCTWSRTCTATPRRWPGRVTGRTRWSCSATSSISSTTPTPPAASSAGCSGPRSAPGSGSCAPRAGRGRLRAFVREAWSRFADPAAVVDEAVREQYTALFAAMTTPTYAIPGNVDVAALWPEFARPGVCQADGQVVTIGGLRFGFVGGTPLPPGIGAVPRRRVDAVRAARPRTTPPPSSGSARSTSCAATPRPPCPSWPTTWSRGVRRRRRRRCSPASAATAPGRPCSGTSTSRSRSVAGSDAPSASTSATSARRPRRTSCAGDRR